ncbi:hypothetical protein GPALN_013181 [Globodera pallida]|nr:hypothetical protein GPALN_013181 [Globodera pallida]
MSHWVWHNVWQVSSNGWGGECDYCLNYDAQTCSLVFLSLGLALLFFGWLLFQVNNEFLGDGKQAEVLLLLLKIREWNGREHTLLRDRCRDQFPPITCPGLVKKSPDFAF